MKEYRVTLRNDDIGAKATIFLKAENEEELESEILRYAREAYEAQRIEYTDFCYMETLN